MPRFQMSDHLSAALEMNRGRLAVLGLSALLALAAITLVVIGFQRPFGLGMMADDREPFAKGAAAAESQLRNGPIAPEAWLVLGEALAPEAAERSRAAVMMACATGPGETRLAARRIRLALQSGAIRDLSVEACVRSDVRSMLRGAPAQKATLTEIDRAADPTARNRLRAVIREVDPGFAAFLSAG